MRIALAVIFLCSSLSGWAAALGQNSARNVQDAKREWETVMAAKGGREKLWSVKTLGVRYQVVKAGRVIGYGREAYDFPSRVWLRYQDPPYRRGMRMSPTIEVLSGDAGIGWIRTDTDYRELAREVPRNQHGWIITDRGLKAGDPGTAEKDASGEVCRASTLYLLETKWYQPEIVAVDESKWIGKDVLVIYVKSCDGPAAYAIDPKTKLPLAYVFFALREFGTELPPLPKRNELGVYRFADYVDVSGLLMPGLATPPGMGLATLDEMKFEINRQYPDSLFTKPPKLSDWGPWPPPSQK